MFDFRWKERPASIGVTQGNIYFAYVHAGNDAQPLFHHFIVLLSLHRVLVRLVRWFIFFSSLSHLLSFFVSARALLLVSFLRFFSPSAALLSAGAHDTSFTFLHLWWKIAMLLLMLFLLFPLLLLLFYRNIEAWAGEKSPGEHGGRVWVRRRPRRGRTQEKRGINTPVMYTSHGTIYHISRFTQSEKLKPKQRRRKVTQTKYIVDNQQPHTPHPSTKTNRTNLTIDRHVHTKSNITTTQTIIYVSDDQSPYSSAGSNQMAQTMQ